MSTELKSLDEISYNPVQEKMLNILRTKTQNIESNLYFRVVSAFYLAQMASNMRVSINTPHRGEIPINMFTCALMESGGGWLQLPLYREILKINPFNCWESFKSI